LRQSQRDGTQADSVSSGSFSINIDPKITIELHSFTTNVGVSPAPTLPPQPEFSVISLRTRQYASYPTTDIRHILPLLVPAFKKVVSSRSKVQAPHGESLQEKTKAGRMEPIVTEPKGKEIKHEWFWQRMGKWFQDTGLSPSVARHLPRDRTQAALTDNDREDIIITETGTSSFGLVNIPLPSHSTYVAQILWGAIGWSVGAALGCALAAKEEGKGRRTVLFVGDGSVQLVRDYFPRRVLQMALCGLGV
jgi:pyruvate decarboxylase